MVNMTIDILVVLKTYEESVEFIDENIKICFLFPEHSFINLIIFSEKGALIHVNKAKK